MTTTMTDPLVMMQTASREASARKLAKVHADRQAYADLLRRFHAQKPDPGDGDLLLELCDRLKLGDSDVENDLDALRRIDRCAARETEYRDDLAALPPLQGVAAEIADLEAQVAALQARLVPLVETRGQIKEAEAGIKGQRERAERRRVGAKRLFTPPESW